MRSSFYVETVLALRWLIYFNYNARKTNYNIQKVIISSVEAEFRY